MNKNKVEVVPYRLEWPDLFQDYKKKLTRFIGTEPVIGHFGSTSVFGMWAKPVIDIGVGVESKDIERVAAELDKMNFARKQHEWYGDPSVAYYCTDETGKLLTHQVHVMPYGENGDTWGDQGSHVFGFRRLLVNNPKVAKLYTGLKIGLADGYKRKLSRYTSGKGDFANAGALVSFEEYGVPNPDSEMILSIKGGLNYDVYQEIRDSLEH